MMQFTFSRVDTICHDLLGSLRRSVVRLLRGWRTVEPISLALLTAAGGTLIGILLRGIVSTPKEAIKDLEKDITELRLQVRELQAEHNKLSNNISSNYTDKNELRFIVSELKEMIKKLEKSIDNLHMKRISD